MNQNAPNPKQEIEISDGTLRISRYFDASRDRVFAAWTDPTQLKQWYGCAQTHSVEATVDCRPQGTLKVSMQGSYGSMELLATYEEVVPPERLVTTMNMDMPGGATLTTRIVVELHEEGQGTRLVLTQTGLPPGLDKNVAGGTSQSLEKLAAFLEGVASASQA